MKISSNQMAALTQSRRAEFLWRVKAFLGQRAQRPVEVGELAVLYERGERYGLVTEQELAGYIAMAWAVDAGRDARDPTWIERIMGDPHRVASDRVAALFRAADAQAGR